MDLFSIVLHLFYICAFIVLFRLLKGRLFKRGLGLYHLPCLQKGGNKQVKESNYLFHTEDEVRGCKKLSATHTSIHLNYE